MAEASPDWLRLQRKIFSRWVSQKLSVRHTKINDVVNDFEDGLQLISLLEILSEKKFEGKVTKTPKLRVQKIDNLNLALEFLWSCGVKLENKPQAEDFVDHRERPILGLVWAVMRKYMKFSDDDESGANVDAHEALLMWFRNQISSYTQLTPPKDFGKCFHDGLYLAALIHKYRPKLIDVNSMQSSQAEANWKKVFAAAEQYFGLEQYLQPSDIPKLDDKSMMVYVSEYYYGIAEQRKLDIAARRIKKLIKFTQVNDGLRNDYNTQADRLNQSLTSAHSLLKQLSSTVHNTMAGAQQNLASFNSYQTSTKLEIIRIHLALESIYNTLALRLSSAKRPKFSPKDSHHSLEYFDKSFRELETIERETKTKLQQELNRQIKLHNWNDQHQRKSERLGEWVAKQEQYLTTVEEIDSIGAAKYQLNVLKAFESERNDIRKTLFDSELRSLGKKLASEKFEKSESEVAVREKTLASSFEKLESLRQQKEKKLNQDLEREIKKEELRVAFANKTGDFVREINDHVQSLGTQKGNYFGFNKAEVESQKSPIEHEESSLTNEFSEKHKSIEQLDSEMTAIGVKENPYTSLTLQICSSQLSHLQKSLVQRRQAWQDELKIQTENDQLCKQFAVAVDSLLNSIKDNRKQIAESQAELDQQLDFVNSKIASASEEKSADEQQKLLTQIIHLENQIKVERKISYNEHSIYSAQDVKVEWDQYKQFLTTKRGTLLDEIDAKKLQGVTKEQMQEIETQFKQFDKDGSGVLDAKEIKAALYSLGEEKSTADVKSIVSQYGSESGMRFEGFKQFMIRTLGDVDTEDEIRQGFVMINRGEKTGKKKLMDALFSDEDLGYLAKEAPAAGGDVDYDKWVKDVFSR